ncbi:hypothetical protein [Reticulibacter mediterranei]|uniref:hypothetical protein n=1 Tax=Reticulibacter mediterranei TaxID=2778369 RepID=UPI001C691D70|nr:hypothetical protein [Reticulibacter mediterranei]
MVSYRPTYPPCHLAPPSSLPTLTPPATILSSALDNIRIDGTTYIVHPCSDWQILIKQDSNDHVYVPTDRTGWEDGGEVEIFTLLPPERLGDLPLLQIRISTKADSSRQVEEVPNPAIAVQCGVPAYTFIDPAKKHIRVQLLCHLVPKEDRLTVLPFTEEEYPQ